MDLEWLFVKVLVRKGCSDKPDVLIGWRGHVLYYLRSFLGVMELIVLCAFVCKVGYFDAHTRETILYK